MIGSCQTGEHIAPPPRRNKENGQMSLLQKSRACIKPGNVDAVIASEAKQSSLVMAFKDEQIMFGSSTETVGQNCWLR